MAIEVWTYAGRRLHEGTTYRHYWLDPNGETLVYGKLVGAVIGGKYNVDVTRGPGEKDVSAKRTVEYTGGRVDPDLAAVWTALDMEASNQRSRLRIQNKHQKEQYERLDDAIEKFIRPFLDECKNSTEVRALANLIDQRIYTLYWKGKP